MGKKVVRKNNMARAISKMQGEQAKKAQRKKSPKTIRNNHPLEVLRRLGFGEFKNG